MWKTEQKRTIFFHPSTKLRKADTKHRNLDALNTLVILFAQKKIPEKFQWKFFKWFIFRQINVGCSFLTLQHVCSLTHERTNSD